MLNRNILLLSSLYCVLCCQQLAAQSNNCTLTAIRGTNGELQQQTTSEHFLFAHTDSSLWTYLPNADQLVVETSLSYLEKGYYVLNLSAKVTAINANAYYGVVQKNALLEFTFLDGTTCQLYNLTQSLPQLIADQPIYQYNMTYVLSGKVIKQLKNNQLHQLRIIWSKRTAQYELYDVTTLMRQFDCLTKDL